MSSNLYLPRDPGKLRKEIRELVKLGYRVQRCTAYHLKIGPVNYFWSTGKITTDPCERHNEKGFQALLDVLERWRSLLEFAT